MNRVTVVVEVEDCQREHQALTMVKIVSAAPHHHHHHHPHRGSQMNPVSAPVGSVLSLSLVFLDQNGLPMDVTPVPDAAPTWTDDTPSVGTLVPAADGLTATESLDSAGVDNVTVELSVGGVPFEATLNVTATGSGTNQVLTSIAIDDGQGLPVGSALTGTPSNLQPRAVAGNRNPASAARSALIITRDATRGPGAGLSFKQIANAQLTSPQLAALKAMNPTLSNITTAQLAAAGLTPTQLAGVGIK
jgi:hypothetical protein